jgi:ubiquinone/menaquinone biosynthesis C-methylase UbiE
MTNDRPFIPALGRDALTPIYDLGIRLTLPERRFKTRLIESAHITAGMRVLDVGCGTGTLLLIAAELAPDAVLLGVDIDDRILERARRKIAARGLPIQLERGSATDLPYADGSFERLLSTLAFHHLTREEKARAFTEAHRVLRPGGELHVGDFGAPDTRYARVASFLTEKLGGEHVQENYGGLLPAMAREAGFVAIEETGRFGTIVGVLRSFRAARPSIVS